MNTNEDLKLILLSIKPRGIAVWNLGMCICVLWRGKLYFSEFYYFFFFVFFIIENVVVEIILKFDTVQRNGKDYWIISDTLFSSDVSYFHLDYKYQNLPSTISTLVSSLINLNWKITKPMMDPIINRFIGDLIQKLILQPIFNKFPFQDICNEFFHINSTCEMAKVSENK